MARKLSEQALGERAQHLLKVLVERYIRDGQPVGSRTLARDAGFDLSPATIRNVMADLEDLGFVAAPHTSAGRIPTVKGYRLFVDTLLTIKPLRDLEVQRLQDAFIKEGDPAELISAVSNMLSEFSKMAGVVTLPKRERVVVQQVEFVQLSENRVLVILVTTDDEVQNRIIHTDRPYTAQQLREAAAFLTAHFAGRDLMGIREGILRQLRDTRESLNRMMQTAIELAEQALTVGPTGTAEGYVLSGQTNLMEFSELSNVERLRQLFEAFNQKRDMLHLLDQCLHAHGVQIFIGEESGYEVLDQCSVVTAPYAVDGQTVGVLGIIGPTRMAYHRVIPIVDVTARMLSAALKPRS